MGAFPGHGLDADADEEILMAAFGLCRPILVSRNLDFAHGIMFDAIFHIGISFVYVNCEEKSLSRLDKKAPIGGHCSHKPNDAF